MRNKLVDYIKHKLGTHKMDLEEDAYISDIFSFRILIEKTNAAIHIALVNLEKTFDKVCCLQISDAANKTEHELQCAANNLKIYA
jgi:hypothetical protein